MTDRFSPLESSEVHPRPFRLIRNVDLPGFFLPTNKPSDAKGASVATSLLGTSHIFVKEVQYENLSRMPLELILGDKASPDLAKFQLNVVFPKEENEHSF